MDRLKEEYKGIDSRRKELNIKLNELEDPPTLFHPCMGDVYRDEVNTLL